MRVPSSTLVRRRPALLPAVFLFAIMALAAGCADDSTQPTPAESPLGGALAHGSLDPGAETFTLEAQTIPPDGQTYVAIQLIGRNLQVLPDSSQITLEVAIRNNFSEALHAPASIALSRFDPADVHPVNSDEIIVPTGPMGEVEYRYDYSAQLGDEGTLEPGETSGFRTWIFSSADLAPFAFAAHAQFGLEPDRPRIAGVAFWDNNYNGEFDRGDQELPFGLIHAYTPDDTLEVWLDDDSGRWSMPIDRTGLYTLRFDPLIDTITADPFAPLRFTTPHPLQVLITPDENGNPHSYLGADFGLATEMPFLPPPVQFTDVPADSLHQMPWELIDVEVLPAMGLRIRVGHSGCEPVQPVSLWVTGGFMESEPVQVNMVFVNESLDECDAWFQHDYTFDLLPLYERYLEAYGSGVLQINLLDFHGEVHPLRWPIER